MRTMHQYKFSLAFAQNYFAKLNPIAEQIARDIQETKNIYGHLWNNLKPNEQESIINETLIKPEITLNYFDRPIPTESSASKNVGNKKSSIEHSSKDSNSYEFDKQNLRTFIKQKVAMKIVQDEINGSFRDEHSAPFSYRTRSQVNLVSSELAQNTKSLVDMSLLIDYKKSPQKYTTSCDGPIYNELESERADIMESLNNDLRQKLSKNNNDATTRHPFATEKISNLNNVIFTGDYFLHEESSKLIENCEIDFYTNSTAFNSDNEDEKLFCEESAKLLTSDTEIRNGFDFLNNW